MDSCDNCPGSVKCTSTHLHPILVRVHDLFAGGMRDKFDILFALGDEDEEALELCDAQVSRECWTKAALWAIVEVVERIDLQDAGQVEAERQLFETIRTARDAFASFPWHLEELVEQAPELYDQICQHCPDPTLCDRVSKRAFIKACRDIVYTP